MRDEQRRCPQILAQLAKERQNLLERHIVDVEAEIEEVKEAVRNGEYEA
jgi:anti-sigma28 factor (negative regulator of flagellin synthesis)